MNKEVIILEIEKNDLVITHYKDEDTLMVIKKDIIEKHLLRANKEIHKFLNKEIKHKDC